MEKLDQNSATLNLDQRQRDVVQALTNITETITGGKPFASTSATSKEENHFVSALATSMFVGDAISIAITAREEAALGSKTDNTFSAGKNKRTNSIFVGGLGETKKTARATSVPLVPLSYAEKKAAARKDA